MANQTSHVLLLSGGAQSAAVLARTLAQPLAAGALFGAFELTHVTQTESAVKSVETQEIDLVMVDLSPGYGLSLEALKNLRQQISLPLIVLAEAEEQAVEAIRAGAQDYVLKEQLQSEVVQRVLHAAIQASRLQRELVKVRYQANLYQQERAQRQLAVTLHEVSRAVTSSLDQEQVLNLILEQLARVVDYDSASVMLLTDEQTLKSVTWRPIHSEHSTIKHLQVDSLPHVQEAIQTRASLLIADTAVDPRWLWLSASKQIRCWMGVPLIAQDRVIGLLNVSKNVPHYYQSQDVQLVGIFADQAAVAIQNALLFQETKRNAKEAKRRAEQLTLLHTIGQEMIYALTPAELCEAIATHLCQTFNYLSVSVFITDLDTGEVVLQAIQGPKKRLLKIGEYRQKLGQGIIGKVAQTGQKIVVNDTADSPDFVASTRIQIRSEMAFPLRAGERTLGVLNVDSDQINAFNESDVAIMSIAADQLAVALEKAYFFEQMRRRTAELEILVEVSVVLRVATDIEEILPIILQHAIQIVNGRTGSIFLIEAETGDLVARGVYPPNEKLSHRRQPGHKGITGHVVATGEIYVAHDLRQDPIFYVLPQELEALGDLNHSISLPLSDQERVVGVMHLGLNDLRTISNDNMRLLTTLCEIAGSALNRVMLLETLEERVIERTQELEAANEQLKELDRLKSKFAADISHELRTPVTNLRLYLDLLTMGSSEKRSHYLEVLKKQTIRLATLVEDVLSLSQLEADVVNIDSSLVNLNKIVEAVVHKLRPRIESANLMLFTQFQDDLPLIAGKQTQLKQMVTNLLVNALNYTSAGEIHVSTAWQREKKRVCLTVRDTGMGIDPQEQKLLFSRFYRGKQTGQLNVPGTGLGLTIVNQIVAAHGGEITVQSQVGVGSTFQVNLPVVGEQ